MQRILSRDNSFRATSPSRLSVRFRWIGLLPLLVFAFLSGRTGAGEESRRVLALFDASEGPADRSAVHEYLEMPLNRLGLVADYHDVAARPLPPTKGYRGIVAWFSDDTMKAPEDYLRWLSQAAWSGTRVVLMNGLGAGRDTDGRSVPFAAIQDAYAALGYRMDEAVEGTDNPFLIETDVEKPEHFGFEAKTRPTRIYYDRLVPVDPETVAWKSIRRTDVEDSSGVVVAVSPTGGMVLMDLYVVRRREQPIYQVQWDLDPFAFLQSALGCEGMLRPDVTTVCGRRAGFAHIDGDGQNNPTIEFPQKPVHTPGPARLSSEVIYDEILTKYPVPVTVSFIAGRVDPQATGREDYFPFWRKVFSLPHVEPSCHGYAHPLNWAKGVVSFEVEGYAYDPKQETLGAIAMLERMVVPEGRRIGIFLWTGDCAPTEPTVALLEEAGILHMNGGNPRLDRLYNSLTHVAPLARPVGRYRQVYAPAGNEYLYTNGWTENWSGQRQVIETFDNTATPRLLPVNLYYHFYLGERQGGLRALKAMYEWSLAQNLCWIRASEYVWAVKGFAEARVGRTEDGGYWIADYGQLPTVRLDDCAEKVDMARSRNVMGYTHHAGSLYVALVPASRAEIRLAETSPEELCLRESTARLRGVVMEKERWRAEARFFAPGFLLLQGAEPGATRKALVQETESTVKADAKGRLRIPLPQGRGEWVEVRLGR